MAIQAKSKPMSFEDFCLVVQKKLGKRPKNSVEIARQLGFIDAEGNVKPYGAAKVRKALKALAKAGLALHEGAFRTSTYRST